MEKTKKEEESHKTSSSNLESSSTWESSLQSKFQGSIGLILCMKPNNHIPTKNRYESLFDVEEDEEERSKSVSQDPREKIGEHQFL